MSYIVERVSDPYHKRRTVYVVKDRSLPSLGALGIFDTESQAGAFRDMLAGTSRKARRFPRIATLRTV